MHLRPVRRAIALALVAALAVAGAASADTVRGRSDVVMPGGVALVELGEVGPSTVLTVQVDFDLLCSGTSHPDAGQTVGLAFAAGSAAPGGAILSVSGASIGPVPASWPDDGETCPAPVPTLGSTTATVTLRAPSTPNVGYVYTVGWSRAVSPAGNADTTAISGGTATPVSFRLSVVTNTAPVLSLPTDLTVEADVTGGWVADYTATASDAEDDPDPAPICSPAAGEVLPLGTTTVACHVVDSGGRAADGTFDVTVADTTAPWITVGGDQDMSTADPAGAILAYGPPLVADVADPAPTVACDPAAGAAIPVGVTTVTCTATDASGNVGSASFAVTVTYEPPPPPPPTTTATATWLEPVGAGTTTFVASFGRTVPVKALLALDGVAVTTGAATLAVAPCGGGSPLELPMAFGGGHWKALVDTTGLVGPCHTVTALVDGHVAGAFTLELRGADAAPTGKSTGKSKGNGAASKAAGAAVGRAR